jgi:HK97 family phage prohead protease
MEHMLLKAATTATEEGVFEAVISTASVDSDRDIVEPAGMVKALQKWAPTGKKIPLAWQHSTAAEDIIGHIDPAKVKQVGTEVVASGWVDQSTERGQHAWRLVKSGTLGFSFGYMVTDATKRKGGGLHIKGLDVFEVTATVIPSNRDTRVLGWKSTVEEPLPDEPQELEAAPDTPVPSTKGVEELRENSKRLEREVEELKIPEIPEQPKAPAEPEIDVVKELQEVKAQLSEVSASLQDLKKKAEVTDQETKSRSVDPLRKRSEELALEVSSGGMSLRTPPTQVKEAREPVDLDALKRESRDLMFEVLSYSTE